MLKRSVLKIILLMLECFDILWEEGYRSDSDGFKTEEIDGGDGEVQMEKTCVDILYNEHQELYDEESLSSGTWSEEDADSAPESSCQHLKTNQDYINYDESEVSSTTSESDINDEIDQNINYQQEQTSQEPKTVPDIAKKLNNEDEKNHITIIYNIIQFNISLFINGEKIEHSVQVPVTSVTEDKMETHETIEEQDMSIDNDKANEVN